jgi:short-subunit dehydrogenase
MNILGCTALVTGASAGIGREIARALAPEAHTIVIVARRGDRLEQLRAELTDRNPALTVHVRVVDLSNESQITALVEWLDDEKIVVDLLVNNAGRGDLGSFVTSDPERVRQIILVNIFALTLLTRFLLPKMIAQQKGGILNVSSSAGFLPIAGFGVYAASKAFVTSFSEALRAELLGSGVSVCALCPGPVETEFTTVANRPEHIRGRSPKFVRVDAAKVARAGLDALEQGRPLVIPGAVMKIAMFITRITPMPLLRLAMRLAGKKLD